MLLLVSVVVEFESNVSHDASSVVMPFTTIVASLVNKYGVKVVHRIGTVSTINCRFYHELMRKVGHCWGGWKQIARQGRTFPRFDNLTWPTLLLFDTSKYRLIYTMYHLVTKSYWNLQHML
jgi:hypothetical protein